MTDFDSDTDITRVWVAFSGQADLPWLRILRPGFRHCFALIHNGRQWITFDPLSNYTVLDAHAISPDFDLAAWLARRGLRIVQVESQRPDKPAPWGMFTCVEAVKRLIGLHDRFVVTPWQLYRRLSRQPSFQFNGNKGAFAWEA